MRRVTLVVNPTAGKGRAARLVEPVKQRLHQHGVQPATVVGDDAADALSKARDAVHNGTDALIALGGDGMANLALRAVVGTRTPFGIIPAGTGNDLATTLGIPRLPLAAADVIATADAHPMDAACAVGQDNWFGCVLGAGFDSVVNERANRLTWPRGKARYNVAIALELPIFKPIPFEITLDGEMWQTDAMLVAVANAKSYGAGLKVAPDAQIDDGLLDVMVVGPVSRVEFVRMFPTVYKGTHVRHSAVTIRRAKTVRLVAGGVTAYADGEYFAPLPLEVQCVAGAVNVLRP